jgi:GWxTD domain-containing protein
MKFLMMPISLVWLATSLLAQTPAQNSFILNVDYARFRYNETASYFEIYYGFYPQLVTLVPTGSGLRGVVGLNMKLTDRKTGSAVIDRHDFLPIVFSDTVSAKMKSTFINQMGFAVPFGDYTLWVLAVDSLQPHRRDSIQLPLSFTPVPTGFAISDLELSSSIKSSQDRSSHYFKNSLEVVPNPTLTFGVTANPIIFSYAELYNVKSGSAYALRSEIVDHNNTVIKEATRTRSYAGTSGIDVATTNVTSLPSGKYRYRLIVSEEGIEVGRTEKAFYVYNPHVYQAMPSVAALRASELAGMTADELAEEFRKAQYVSTDQENRLFSAITSEEGRRKFLAEFWAEVEKGRMGRPPITRAEYMQRVAAANEKYRSFGREGWQTDRGRVFILYGEPSEVERIPSSGDAKPHEVWRYLDIENGAEFIFIDRSGFGDYILVHSTKRGELRDETWQRLLR